MWTRLSWKIRLRSIDTLGPIFDRVVSGDIKRLHAIAAKSTNGPDSVKSRPSSMIFLKTLLQQLQERFRRGIRLRERGYRRLFENLRLGQIRSLLRDVGISNLRFRRRFAGDLGLSQTNGVLEIVLAGSHCALNVT